MCLYESQSIFRYIHFARLISEARLIRSPVDIDRDQGSVGNGGPFLLRALRYDLLRGQPFKDSQAPPQEVGGERDADSNLEQLND
jgi:hypothetical protein